MILVLAFAGGAAVADGAATKRLERDRGKVRADLQLRAKVARGKTIVAARGTVRSRVRGARLVLRRCRTVRCDGRDRRFGDARRLRRGRSRLNVRLFTRAAPRVRVELRARGRLLAGVRLRPARDLSRPAPRPVPAPPSSPAPFSLKLSPRLSPAFDPAISDYTVRCKPPSPVVLEAFVPPGRQIALDGGPPLTGAVRQEIVLDHGEGFRFTVDGSSAHSVRCLPPDFPEWHVGRVGDAQVELLAFSPSLGANASRYAIIADDHGVPLWWHQDEDAAPVDARVLPDGSVAWARYTGGGFSRTVYERRALDGTLIGALSTVGVGADHHDMQALPNGNFLMVAYTRRRGVDLSALGGPTDATVFDAEIQEVTPTGAFVWAWNSSDHIPVEETAAFGLENTITTWDGEPVYDLFHINSAEQQPDGTIVVSGRHVNAVYGIRRSDGGVSWKLGGTPRAESLALVGDPHGDASFGGQHDARILDDGTLTVHDNGTGRGRPQRAVRYRLDLVARSATLLEQVVDARFAASNCCGSSRRLPGGHWLVTNDGGAVTELDPSGRPVLTLSFSSGFSYRAQPVPSSLVDAAALRAAMDGKNPRRR